MKEKKFINEKFSHLMHGGDYNPEQWIEDKQVWDEDMKLMKKAACNEMTVGIFSWATLEPEEGKYDFSFLDEIIEKIYQNGGRVVLATPSGARPHWMADKYPEVLRVNSHGERQHFGARHNHCYTSPVYREKVREINTLLAQRYGKHPAVVAWHISNEYGGMCYCPLCQEAFRNYLKERYQGSIEKLNRAYWSTFWSHTYTDFEQIEAPSEIGETCIHGLNLDWRRFVSHQTLDFMRAEIKPIKKFSPDVPVTTNMMPAFYDLNYWEFADSLDVAAWDSYPDWHLHGHFRTAAQTAFWHDFFRSLKKRPFMLMESAPGLVNWKEINKLKRPGMDKLSALQAIAHGSDTVQYFQWRKSRGSVEKFHGAVVDHVGTDETRVFKAVKETGELLQKIDEVAGSAVESKVAIIFDWENRWALDDSQGFKRYEKRYADTCVDYYETLWRRAVSVDIVSAHGDFSGYDLVIAPMLYMTDEDAVSRLEKYVRDGGTLYATYLLGMVDGTDLCYLRGFPSGKLKEVFGIWNEEIDTLCAEERGRVASNDKKEYEAQDFCEVIHLRGAKALAEYAADFYRGAPAYTVNDYGKGRAYYQAFRDTGEFKAWALKNILDDLKIKGAIPTADGNLPQGVTAHRRTNGEDEFLFVENYSGEAVENISLGKKYTDMETAETVSSVSLFPYGIKVLKADK